MKIWVMSDLHADVADWTPPECPPEHDVLVIAGDVRDRLTTHVLPWLSRAFEGSNRPIVYVPGNHDFYRMNYERELERAPAEAAARGITLLMDGSDPVVIDGVRFAGATLWSDYRIHGDRMASMAAASGRMNDHRFIRTTASYRKAAPWDMERFHANAIGRLRQVLETPHDGPTVVVTHHAPSPRSLDRRRERAALDGSYASDLEDLIAAHAPELWIHGHIHHPQDYRIGTTRVVANPRGYIFARRMHGRTLTEFENSDFDPSLVVEIPDAPAPGDDCTLRKPG